MGAGTAVDGRTVTKEVLEQKIAETLALPPCLFGREHATVNGRKNAVAIIEAVGAAKGKIKSSPPPTGE